MRTVTKAGLMLAFAGGPLLLTHPTQADPGHGTLLTALPIDFSLIGVPNYAGGSSQLTVAGEQDYYAFQVYTGGYIQYGVGGQGLGSSLTLPNPEMDLFDSTNTPVLPSGGYFSVSPGVYFPRIMSTTGGTGTYNYSLSGAGQGPFGTATFGRILPRAAVPEPSTLPLLGLGIGGVLLAVRRRRRSA